MVSYLTVSLPAQSHLRGSWSLTLSLAHLSGSRSHCRLSLLLTILPLLTISPSPHARDLTATANTQSLSPTDPVKGHDTPIELSLSVTLKFCSKFGLGCFSFCPYVLYDLVNWVVGLLVWIVWNFDFYSSVFVVLLDWNFDRNSYIFVVLLSCWSTNL